MKTLLLMMPKVAPVQLLVVTTLGDVPDDDDDDDDNDDDDDDDDDADADAGGSRSAHGGEEPR